MILLVCNLGLGDGIILNAVIRDLARKHDLVCVPAKYHNVGSIQFMLRDLPNVVIRPLEDHKELRMFAQQVWKGDILCTEVWPKPDWDQRMYALAGLSFQLRWDWWKCERDKTSEIQAGEMKSTGSPYAFVHDDKSRGMIIPFSSPTLRTVRPHSRPHIFGFWSIIEQAEELHCISSCFALFADSIDLPKQPKLFLYANCRPGELLPTFRHPWTIIQ